MSTPDISLTLTLTFVCQVYAPETKRLISFLTFLTFLPGIFPHMRTLLPFELLYAGILGRNIRNIKVIENKGLEISNLMSGKYQEPKRNVRKYQGSLQQEG